MESYLGQKIIDCRLQIINANTKYISFDLFDTLVVRPVLEPADLFYIVEKRAQERNISVENFLKARKYAEKSARDYIKIYNPEYEDVTLDEIYTRLQKLYRLDCRRLEILKNIELEVELDYLEKRKIVYELYQLAVEKKKRIIVVTDVYLPGNFIYKILNKCGYDKVEKIFVSSDLRASKGSGSLYSIVIQNLKVKPSQILHIGDNNHADYKKAQVYGINAFHLPKASEIALKHSINWQLWHNRENKLSMPFRYVLGFLSNRVFDTIPKTCWQKNSLFNGDPYLLGYYGGGHFLLFLTLWLIRNVKLRKYDKLAFVARDGRVPLEVYKIVSKYFKETPESLYLLSSRALCFSINDTSYPNLLFSDDSLYLNKNLTNREIIQSRFFDVLDDNDYKQLEKCGVKLDDKLSDFTTLIDTVFSHISTVNEKIEKLRNSAINYYDNILGNLENVAIFDAGYSGRLQFTLQNILKRQIDGYYIASFETISKNDIYGINYFNYINVPQNRNFDGFHLISSILEILISDISSGSVNYIGAKGPNFSTVEYGSKEKEIISKIHQGIIDFNQEFSALFREDLKYFYAAPNEVTYTIRHFIHHPSNSDAQIFLDFVFSNGMLKDDFCLVSKNRDRSMWKQGHDILFKNITTDNSTSKYTLEYLQTIPLKFYLSHIAKMCRFVPNESTIAFASSIVRKSRYRAARYVIKNSGGITKSKFSFYDKIKLLLFPLYYIFNYYKYR